MPPDFLDSREDAILVWAILLVGFALSGETKGIAGAFFVALRILVASKLGLVFASAALYSAAVLYGAKSLGIWHTTGTKEAVYWFLGTALILVGHAIEWADDQRVLTRLLRQGLKLTIFIEFFVNLYVLPLAAEMVLIPLAVAFVGAQVIAERDVALKVVRRPVNFMTGAIGLR